MALGRADGVDDDRRVAQIAGERGDLGPGVSELARDPFYDDAWLESFCAFFNISQA